MDLKGFEIVKFYFKKWLFKLSWEKLRFRINRKYVNKLRIEKSLINFNNWLFYWSVLDFEYKPILTYVRKECVISDNVIKSISHCRVQWI